jgi:aminomethyltransferase
MAELRATPLHTVHLESGAKMMPFSGWDMPVEYSGLIAEHQAVRRAAGLFDVSHMGQFEVKGAGALAFLQRVTANDVAKLVDGQAQYSALPLPTGCPVDDVIVYRRAPDRYLIVVNAANLAKDWEWLRSQSPAGCALEDRSEAYALIALQGPKAESILQPLTPIDLKAVGFYRFAEGSVAGHEAIVARTGYTGEDGFELFVSPQAAPEVWRKLVAAGGPQGLLPAGLGARDTLRLEAGMNLYGSDMSQATHPLESGLGWTIAWEPAERDFVGRRALEAIRKSGSPRKLVGLMLEDRGVLRSHQKVVVTGVGEGEITSGTFSPTLERSIALARVPAATAAGVQVDIRGKLLDARVVKPPFVRHGRILVS